MIRMAEARWRRVVGTLVVGINDDPIGRIIDNKTEGGIPAGFRANPKGVQKPSNMCLHPACVQQRHDYGYALVMVL